MKLYYTEHIYGDYNNHFLIEANTQKEAIDILYNYYCDIGYSGTNVENRYKPIPKCELRAREIEKMFKEDSYGGNLVGLN